MAATFTASAGSIYENRGNIYQTPAMLSDLQHETARLNTYTYGNSKGIQHLSRVKVDNEVFVADQKRQDEAVQALNDQATQISNTINNHGDVLSSHQQQIDALGSRMSNEIAGAMNRANEAHKEAKIAQDQAAAALSVAGQQFDLNYNGFQTAISAATFGGSTALSVGAGGKISERVFVNAAITNAGSATGGVVSSTFRW